MILELVCSAHSCLYRTICRPTVNSCVLKLTKYFYWREKIYRRKTEMSRKWWVRIIGCLWQNDKSPVRTRCVELRRVYNTLYTTAWRRYM